IPPGCACRRPARTMPGFGKVAPKPWRRRIARRLHTPGMRAPRALPGGRLDAHNAHLILPRALTTKDGRVATKVTKDHHEGHDGHEGSQHDQEAFLPSRPP